MEPLASTSARARRESPTLPLGGVGRIPPQAIELEEAVLGALLIDRDALTKVVDILAAESFYVRPTSIFLKPLLTSLGSRTPLIF